MFPSGYLSFALVLICGQFAAGQTVVNSTFLNRHPASGYDNYNNPNNWSPAEVPNNTAARLFNLNITTFFEVNVTIDATISNLTLGGSSTGLGVFGKMFTVTGTTTNEIYDGYIDVESLPGAPGKFDAGALSSFSDHRFRGNYNIKRATLQFRGADIWSFGDGTLYLAGPLAAVLDEAGNDALRNLARIEASGTIILDGQDLVTNAPFLNEGSMRLGSIITQITFTAASGLMNFDASNRTLSGGTFDLSEGTLRFDGADVVNLASTIYVGTSPGLTDLAGNDGLRNLARILPGGVLHLGVLRPGRRDFTAVGSFTNDGELALNNATFTVTSALNNFDATSRTLTGGTYSITSSVLKFSSADIVHNQASLSLSQASNFFRASITDLAGNDALRNFNDNLASGSFTVDPGQLFVAPGNFTNAGKVTTNPRSPAHDDRGTAEFRVPAGSFYTQTAGATVNGAMFTADINILGGSFFNRAVALNGFGVQDVGQIKGNLNVSNGMLVPGGAVTGNLTLGTNARFHPTIGRFTDSIRITGSTTLNGTLEVELTGYRFPASSEVITLLQSSGPMSGTFSNAPNGARIKTTEGGASYVVLYESNAVKLTGFELPPSPAQLLNISTRAALFAANNDPQGDRSVLIAGFIISGAQPKKVVVRGMGPSLAKAGVSSSLPDPILELHASDGSIIATNNDWRDTQEADLVATGLAPQDDREAAVLATLPSGTYTVVIREKNGLAGTGLVEVYDLSASSNSKLANISSRGFADNTNVLIGGVIAGGPGEANAELVVRALGPSLHFSGVVNALVDLTLELRDANGNAVGFNQDALAIGREFPSAFSGLGGGESAIRVSLPRGNYTALVRAKPDRGGIALVEFYDLRP
jgi:hypothetical protein